MLTNLVIDPGMIITLFFILFFIFVFLGIPITFSLGLSGLIALLLGGAKLSLAFKAIFMPYNINYLLGRYTSTGLIKLFSHTNATRFL